MSKNAKPDVSSTAENVVRLLDSGGRLQCIECGIISAHIEINTRNFNRWKCACGGKVVPYRADISSALEWVEDFARFRPVHICCRGPSCKITVEPDHGIPAITAFGSGIFDAIYDLALMNVTEQARAGSASHGSAGSQSESKREG